MSPHDSQFIQANVRQPFKVPLDSAFHRQIENEQQSTVGEVSQPLKVMALASRLAGRDNAVPSLPGSDSWLSKKKEKKSGAYSCTSWCRLHFGCCRNILPGRQQTCFDRLDVGFVTRLDFV